MKSFEAYLEEYIGQKHWLQEWEKGQIETAYTRVEPSTFEIVWNKWRESADTDK